MSNQNPDGDTQEETREESRRDRAKMQLARLLDAILGKISVEFGLTVALSLTLSFTTVYAVNNYTTVLSTSYDGQDFAISGRTCPSGQVVTGINREGVVICSQAVVDNAPTATRLAVDGSNCPTGSYPVGVDPRGNAQGCSNDSDTTYSAERGLRSSMASLV